MFPLFGTNLSATVESTYTGVTISSRPDREVYKGKDVILSDLLRQRAGHYVANSTGSITPLAAIDGSTGIFALLGTPGSGKTTNFRHVAMAAAKGHTLRGSQRLPIYLAVRDIPPSGTILVSSRAFFSLLGLTETERVVNALFSSGKCIVLVDGLDETTADHQTSLLRELTAFQVQFPETIFCISARPDSLHVGIGGASKWETLPLSLDDRFALSRKWFDAVDPAKGDRFIEACSHTPAMLDLGSNPLLLCIICALYYNELDVPSEPAELYTCAVEGMLGRWDSFRNVARQSCLSSLSIQKRFLLASALAAALFDCGYLVFGRTEVLECRAVDETADRLGLGALDIDALLSGLANDFGILVERSPHIFSFSHLTMQEFLVARYIDDNRREMSLLFTHINDPAWSEVIVMVAKLLPDAGEFLRYIFQSLKFNIGTSIYLAARVVAVRPIVTRKLKKRLCSTFATNSRPAPTLRRRRSKERGDVVISRFRRESSLQALENAVKAAKRAQADENAVSSEENGDTEGTATKVRAKRARKRGSAPRRASELLAIFGYITEINGILNDMDFSPRENGLNSPFLLAVSGPKRELILKTLLDESQQNDGHRPAGKRDWRIFPKEFE